MSLLFCRVRAQEPPPGAMEETLALCAARRSALAAWCRDAGLHPQAVREAREALRFAPDPAAERIEVECRLQGAPPAACARLGEYRARVQEEAVEGAAALAGAAESLPAGSADRDWLLSEALRCDPDCAAARRALGQVSVPLLGWLPGPLPAPGHRRVGNAWIPPDQFARERARRRDWASAWEVVSEHYRVRSDLPYDEVLRLAERAEALYRVFDRLFGRDAELRPPPGPLDLQIHAGRSAYDAHAREAHGCASGGPPTGYFSASDGAVHVAPIGRGVPGGIREVLFHEGTHQLVKARLSEPVGSLDGRPGFWAVEGIACAMEAYTRVAMACPYEPPEPTPHWRIREACDQARRGALPSLDRIALWTDADLMPGAGSAGRYAAAAAVAHFLVHAEGGRRRGAFLAYLREVEDGRSEAGSFERAFGCAPADLDGSLLAYLRALTR